MRSNIMVSLKPTQCAVSTGKCSHLEFSNSSGEDGAAAGFQPRPLAQAGAAVPGHTVHSANSLSLPCPNDWQDFQNPGPGSSRFSCYIFLKKKKFSMEERFLLWKKKNGTAVSSTKITTGNTVSQSTSLLDSAPKSSFLNLGLMPGKKKKVTHGQLPCQCHFLALSPPR